jgi:hypothetical protein
LYACLWVYKSSLIGDSTIGANKYVVRDRLAEDLNLEYICDDLFRLAVDIRVDECDIVIACNNVSKRGETLLNPLNRNGVRQGVAQVLELLVGCGGRDEEAVPVTCKSERITESANEINFWKGRL